MGPMFRRERPQKGRYRQFYQIGAEAIGSESPVIDAEVIEMVVRILRNAGLTGISAAGEFRGMPELPAAVHRAAAQRAAEREARMCEDCQRRADTNPLRVLDCKIRSDQPIIEKLPSILDHLCEVCKPHFDAVQSLPARRGDRRSKSGRAWCAVSITTCARRLKWCTAAWARRIPCWAAAATTASPNRSARKYTAPGIGFSIGEDRLVMSVEETGQTRQIPLDLFIAPLGEAASRECARLARELRATASRWNCWRTAN